MNDIEQAPAAALKVPAPAADSYLGEARGLADALLETAHELPDGSLSWGRGAGRDQIPVDDSGPFNGRCGEALLFAALARATGRESYGEVALRALGTLRRRLPDPAYRRALVAELSFGIGGSGGLLYALLHIAGFLEREDLAALGAELAAAFTPETIAADDRHDVVWGSAGAIPGLLRLAERGHAGALAQAIACGEQLLARRVADRDTGLRAWATLKEVASVGFAHGASGIANALLQLAAATGRRDFYRAAIESFDFERLMWHEAGQNWCDSRVEPQPYMWGWCHGATGVGLARLAALELLEPGDEQAITLDLHRAIGASIAARIPGVDSLCCGYLGRIDFLLETGRLLGNASVEQQAHRLMRERIGRARHEGYLFAQGRETPEPHLGLGLWQGPTGLAYFLLRMSDPETFPSLLRLA